MNKNANKRKRKRKLTTGDSTIAYAFKYGFDGVQELEKMKMHVTKEIISQILESEQQGRQLFFQSQLPHCRGLQTKRYSKWFSIDFHWFLVLCECGVEMSIV